MDREYIKIRSMSKVAYLYSKNCFEAYVEAYDDGDIKYLFAFKNTEEVRDLIEEYNNNIELRNFNKSFKNVKFRITQLKQELRNGTCDYIKVGKPEEFDERIIRGI